MLRHTLLRMGQDAWLLAAATLSIMALSIIGLSAVAALTDLFGGETNNPQWVIVTGYIAIASFPFWLIYKWFESAKRRVNKRIR